MPLFRLLLLTILFTSLLTSRIHAQSDIIQKGENGFEMLYNHAFINEKDGHEFFIGYSLNGNIDFTAELAKVAKNSAVAIGGAYHKGGQPEHVGLALNASYVFQKEANYFIYGPSIYAYLDSDGTVMIPEIGFQFSTLDAVGFAGIFGISVYTKGPVGFIFRPQFVYTDIELYFSFGIGLLLRE